MKFIVGLCDRAAVHIELAGQLSLRGKRGAWREITSDDARFKVAGDLPKDRLIACHIRLPRHIVPLFRLFLILVS
jgi:hypothetical protein